MELPRQTGKEDNAKKAVDDLARDFFSVSEVCYFNSFIGSNVSHFRTSIPILLISSDYFSEMY